MNWQCPRCGLVWPTPAASSPPCPSCTTPTIQRELRDWVLWVPMDGILEVDHDADAAGPRRVA